MRTLSTFIVFFVFIRTASFGQDCQVAGEQDWQKVTLKVMDEDELDSLEVLGFLPIGEAFIETKKKIKQLKHLSKEEVKQLKMKGAGSRSCLVYVDTSYYYGEDQLYCIWISSTPEER